MSTKIKTKLGRWSVWLITIFFALFILVQIVAAIGRAQGAFEPERSLFYAIALPAIIIPAGLSGIAAFIIGLISIIKFKERSWLVYLSCFVGLLVLLFVLGEFLFPH